ncbi:SURF1 family protein [Candidatus Thiothrix sp. Deng01]|uniref:SURF1-like protein n=1 Tax=Candidatus Thiothrix phosphatis TaxID=3112415 RepID=A0ABU6CXK6_9GAMM|nr:SURF1 family protein [Candidatus Thiothrix sp. Deng01]MEB4591485.1 SURF1 family protein [Candidatus Thiothrix sp. Deng01]
MLQHSENASITASYRFRPTVFATLLTVVVVGVFAALSVWQYQRAQYKQQLAQDIARQSGQPAINLNQAQVDWPAQRFRAAEVTGSWETGGTLLLDNVVQQGRAGYHVVTPLRLAVSGRHILVNRGWVEVGASRQALPAIPTPSGEVRLAGSLDFPRSKPFFLFGEMPADAEGNQRWLYLDKAKLEQKLGYPLPAYILLQTSAAPDGLDRDWPPFDSKVWMHIGYSIQWAVFGLIALSAYLYLNMRKHTEETV